MLLSVLSSLLSQLAEFTANSSTLAEAEAITVMLDQATIISDEQRLKVCVCVCVCE